MSAQFDEALSTFIRGFAALQRVSGPVRCGVHDEVQFLEFARGRRLSRFTHEFFSIDGPVERAIHVAREVAVDRPHLISVLGAQGPSQINEYLANGYGHWGGELLMRCDLSSRIEQSAAVKVRAIDSLATAERIEAAEREAGLNVHPITAAHLASSDLLQFWVELEGKVAAFARLVLLERTAFLADVVTIPSFRRRGCAGALVRSLLEPARETGSVFCSLVSSDMAVSVYRSIGFAAIAPLTGFETPESKSTD